MALTRQENPELFDAIKKELSSFYMQKAPKEYLAFLSESSNEISDERLASIKSFSASKYNIGSLKGISKLKNLEELKIDGLSQEAYTTFALHEIFTSPSKSSRENLGNAINSRFYSNQYNKRDIEEVYELKNLKYLSMNYQRYIKNIDLEKLPKLTTLNCKECLELRSVENMSKVEALKDSTKVSFDFSGCNKLNDINDIAVVKDEIELKNKIIMLPTATFMFLQNRYKLFSKKEKFNSIFTWTEDSVYMSRVRNNTEQMLLVKMYIDELINKYCDKNASDIEKIFAIHTWITKNVKYDYKNFNKERENKLKNKTGDIYDQKNISNKMRSSHVALFDREAICVGISYLFNIMLADLGLLSENAYVQYHSKDEFASVNSVVLPNHQISAVNINGEKYYFDPTGDLNKPSNDFKHFGLNKNEASTRYRLFILEETVKSGESIYAKAKAYANYDKGALRLMEEITESRMFEDLEAEKI